MKYFNDGFPQMCSQVSWGNSLLTTASALSKMVKEARSGVPPSRYPSMQLLTAPLGPSICCLAN